ncbi:MAG: 30S ribosomal protein S6 [Deltaproteobacteria bacterium GWA2_38_16]|nr:MAG: 30S ribosomal protein S6 [Deltaproteobacteria bacterium GWA2_38_16]OGQ02870.1 MAG: 30S ribosomal protein S6 [Deltaproteobacteria bacterium RIFCSPHIGHO2_02_FULL_38_15]OGQ35113.1 MAG: 30S ribosomal protein S6 [Deltaproteobacteria bacterium RIFCSPLOWO2_01_FULL_38_9]OGQ61687.1 MAG: 30S ribosomal protein S6 [Deltaproteobacteria bacterium RIFCSPLOWO2_12_FULL_38_8]HBQ21716.1 30S ribosomal protein S6 [Deltaproteobacteria bacterium]
MVTYETIYIADPNLAENKVGEINTKVTEIIKRFDGKVNNLDDWGNRKLGYKINKQTIGHYIYINYSAKPGVVSELERTLQLRDDVLKQMTIRVVQ